MTKTGRFVKAPSVLFSLWARAARDCRGGIAVTFSLALIPLLGCLALAVDVSTWYAARTKLQAIADGAAIASARELRLGRPTQAQLVEAARRYSEASLQRGSAYIREISIDASLSRGGDAVRVEMTSEVHPIFSRFVTSAFYSVSVESTARLTSTIPVCMIGLDGGASGTLRFENHAQLDARECGIYSNSSSDTGLRIEDSATLSAKQICSAGGIEREGGTTVQPAPLSGCPRLTDPLAARAAEIGNPCNLVENILSPHRITGNATLRPGNFCDGIVIASGAPVTFEPGIYHIGGAGLVAATSASLSGNGVAFHFVNDATFNFGPDTTIDFSAPTDGPLAGILFLGNLQATPKSAFRISSNDARRLLGTIYLPHGELVIDSRSPVAGDSAYTVIVARRIKLENAPRLVLNTNYAATDVPVPEGVGPNSPIHLSQ